VIGIKLLKDTQISLRLSLAQVLLILLGFLSLLCYTECYFKLKTVVIIGDYGLYGYLYSPDVTKNVLQGRCFGLRFVFDDFLGLGYEFVVVEFFYFWFDKELVLLICHYIGKIIYYQL